jgi:hypothetical protein
MAVCYFTELLQDFPEVTEKAHDNLNWVSRPPGQQSNPEQINQASRCIYFTPQHQQQENDLLTIGYFSLK